MTISMVLGKALKEKLAIRKNDKKYKVIYGDIIKESA